MMKTLFLKQLMKHCLMLRPPPIYRCEDEKIQTKLVNLNIAREAFDMFLKDSFDGITGGELISKVYLGYSSTLDEKATQWLSQKDFLVALKNFIVKMFVEKRDSTAYFKKLVSSLKVTDKEERN
jgi:hypothetical protein